MIGGKVGHESLFILAQLRMKHRNGLNVAIERTVAVKWKRRVCTVLDTRRSIRRIEPCDWLLHSYRDMEMGDRPKGDERWIGNFR